PVRGGAQTRLCGRLRYRMKLVQHVSEGRAHEVQKLAGGGPEVDAFVSDVRRGDVEPGRPVGVPGRDRTVLAPDLICGVRRQICGRYELAQIELLYGVRRLARPDN